MLGNNALAAERNIEKDIQNNDSSPIGGYTPHRASRFPLPQLDGPDGDPLARPVVVKDR